MPAPSAAPAGAELVQQLERMLAVCEDVIQGSQEVIAAWQVRGPSMQGSMGRTKGMGEMTTCTLQVYKLKQSDEDTGTSLLKALGAKSFLAGRSAPKPRVLCLTVRCGGPLQLPYCGISGLPSGALFTLYGMHAW